MTLNEGLGSYLIMSGTTKGTTVKLRIKFMKPNVERYLMCYDWLVKQAVVGYFLMEEQQEG